VSDIVTHIALVIGALLTAGGALFAALRKAKRDGAQQERDKANADYVTETKRQAGLDVGHGATDLERIGLLEAIRDRKRTGKD
jgi:hypothetical protein